MPFGGDSYDPRLDRARLSKQLRAVRDLMVREDRWWTLPELRERLGYPEASISARIRDLRKPPLNHRVERRRVAGTNGLWEYRVVLEGKQLSLPLDLAPRRVEEVRRQQQPLAQPGTPRRAANG